MNRYWLTPPELEYLLRQGRFDPTPYPHHFGDRNALLTHWEKPWYLNPPFSMAAKFVRKAIEEGGPGTIVFPVTTSTDLLLKAGARLEPLGRVFWVEAETGKRDPKGTTCAIAYLPPGKPDRNGGAMTPCEQCEEENGPRKYPAFARLLEVKEGTGLLCMVHLRELIEMMRFLASEGAQTQEDIEAHLVRYVTEYPWPGKVVD